MWSQSGGLRWRSATKVRHTIMVGRPRHPIQILNLAAALIESESQTDLIVWLAADSVCWNLPVAFQVDFWRSLVSCSSLHSAVFTDYLWHCKCSTSQHFRHNETIDQKGPMHVVCPSQTDIIVCSGLRQIWYTLWLALPQTTSGPWMYNTHIDIHMWPATTKPFRCRIIS